MKCKAGNIHIWKEWPECLEDKCYFWNGSKCKLRGHWETNMFGIATGVTIN